MGASEAAIAAANEDWSGAATNLAAGGYGSAINQGYNAAKDAGIIPSPATASVPNAQFSAGATPGREVAPGEAMLTLPDGRGGVFQVKNPSDQTVTVGGTAAVTPEESMRLGQRNVANYQPGVSMSEPLQNLATSGQQRGAAAQGMLSSYGQNASQYGADAAALGMNQGLSYGAQGAGYGADASKYGSMGAGFGAISGAVGRDAMGVGSQGNTLAQGYAGQLADAGNYAAGMGSAYGNAVANSAQGAGQFAAGGMNAASQSRTAMMGAGGQLQSLEGVEGPSAAQAQFNQNMGNAMANNIALSRSGRGFGGNSAAQSEALRANAAMGANAADQSAQLRAQENAAWRARQGQNIANAASIYGNAGGLGLNAGQLGLQGNAQTTAGLAQAGQLGLAGIGQQSQNLGQAGQLGLAGANTELAGINTGLQGFGQGMQGAQVGIQGAQAGMQGSQVGLQGVQTGLQGQQIGMQGEQVGGALAASGYGLGFQGDQQVGQAIAQDQAAKQAYEGMLTQQQGIQAGVAVQNAASSNAFTGGLMNMAGAAIPMLMMASDVRTKENIVSMEDQAAQADKAAQERADAMRGYGGQPVVGPTGPGFQASQAMRVEAEKKAAHDAAYQRGLQSGLRQFGQSASRAWDNAGATARLPDFGPLGNTYRDPGAFAGFGAQQASDERVKENVADEDPAIDAALKTPGVSFDYKDPERFGGGRQYGVMADDLLKSEAGASTVGKAPDEQGTKMVSIPKLTMLQQAELHSIAKRLKKLEGSR